MNKILRDIERMINSLAYIAWSLSLWLLSYYQVQECNFVDIRDDYLKAFWLFAVAAIIYMGSSWQELMHEIIKSVTILVGSSLMNMSLRQIGDIEELVEQAAILFCYQVFAFVIVIFMGRSEKLHGKYAKKLELLFLAVLGVLYFVFGWNICISFLCACIIDVFVGYKFYLKTQGENGTLRWKVKYKHSIYSVNFVDKIKIELIKAVLILKRIKRRVYIFVPKNIVLYLILTLCWIFFGIATYQIGIEYKEPDTYTVKDVIWDLKNSYFTSVILALFIAGYSQSSGHRKRMEIQHEFYTNIMEKFELLFSPFIGDEVCYYMPFYNDLCLNSTLEYVEQCNMEELAIQEDEFVGILETILDQISKIEQEMRNNNIIGMHKHDLEVDIEIVRHLLKHMIREGASSEQVKDNVRDLAIKLYYIIADIRRPWRWDVENNNKILKILANYNENDIKNDFYYRMHLYGHILKRSKE